MDLGQMAFQDGVVRGVRKFADKANQEIQELDELACLYADQRDSYKSELAKTQKALEKYQESFKVCKQYLDDANANIVKMNASYAELKEYAEEKSEGCEVLARLSRERLKIISAKDAEIAALKKILDEHGINTEPSGMKP